MHLWQKFVRSRDWSLDLNSVQKSRADYICITVVFSNHSCLKLASEKEYQSCHFFHCSLFAFFNLYKFIGFRSNSASKHLLPFGSVISRIKPMQLLNAINLLWSKKVGRYRVFHIYPTWCFPSRPFVQKPYHSEFIPQDL